MKVSGRKFIILILYFNGILLVTNDVALLHDVKKLCYNKFEMKDMDEAFYVIGIKIFSNRPQRLLTLSHKGYMNKILERFIMDKCSTRIIPIH